MSSTTSISVSEYLNSNFLWFGQHQDEWHIEVLPEQRIRISPTKYRVPDICLVSLDEPVEQILTRPPLEATEFAVTGTPIRLVLSELFAKIRR